MGLIVTLKDKVAQKLALPDLGDAFRQVEIWAGKQKPYFEAYLANAQSIPNAAQTVLGFDTVVYDTFHAYKNQIYTFPLAGVWVVNAWMQWANNAVGVRGHGVNTLGYNFVSAATDSSGLGRMMDSWMWYAGPNTDSMSFQITVYQSSGGPLNTATGKYVVMVTAALMIPKGEGVP